MKRLILAVAMSLPLVSCTDGVCPTVIHAAVQSQTKVSDAMRALDQARAVSQGVPMPAQTRANLEKEIARGLKVLTEINVILAASISACNDPMLDDKFDAFNAAWFAIKKILSLFGEDSIGSIYVGPHGAGINAQPVPVPVKIPDPFFYKEP